MIGLFAIATGGSIGALGPMIMMIILLIFTALYHISLNTALGPLIEYLPKSLEAEELRLLEEDRANENIEKESDPTHVSDIGTTPKKTSVFKKFLRPDLYTDFSTLRRLVPKEIEIRYEPEVEEHAYFHPSVNSNVPLLWIPRDPMGVSRQEVHETGKVIPITDEAARLDEKNKIIWDAEDGRPPIYEAPVYY